MRLKSPVRDLKSAMELSKLKAIRENANVASTFDTGTNSYTVFVDNGVSAGVANDWTPNGSEEVLRTVTMPSDVTMYDSNFSGAPQCRFNSRGLPDGMFGHVYMRNTNDNFRRITLSTVGHVQSRSGYHYFCDWKHSDAGRGMEGV
ncbi:MAG: hypothetical protein DRG66_03875 [Deltaproteobacteria bacterium]|jgi:Tfp pilus assembly protein FimT|nr:MAG: hypothetical protein DRG66_03875 [Deltaproteobacteria bacterium]